MDAFRPDMTVDLLTPNSYSRPETGTSRIRNIVLHYTANPGATAKQNRDYFEGLKDTHLTKASSHFIVGLDGEIVQCIPTWEVAYASNNRNGDTVSIECCHPDESGSFNQKTYDSMVRLSAWLCLKFNLTENDLIRHYDVTGKSARNISWTTRKNGHSFRLMSGKCLKKCGKLVMIKKGEKGTTSGRRRSIDMKTEFDVIALGELLIDFTMNGTSSQGNQVFEACPGGAPCNVLAMLNKLGKKTAFIGKVGQDQFGLLLKQTLENAGICTEYLYLDPDIHTTLAFVHTLENGDRDFSFYRNPGADMMLTEEEVELDFLKKRKSFISARFL